ncbi:MAG TPA: S8 family serine peptidase [Saprospiraceae bacterium]|nr:S8 family serine peptidase [Saprospiraceae bacterium]
MKKIFTLLFLIIYSILSFAQFPHKNPRGLEHLLEKSMQFDYERTKRIETFLIENPAFEGVIVTPAKTYYITDVINGQPVFITTYNEESAQSVGVNHLRSGGSLGLNLTGKGMKVGVWDGGVARDSHQEFERRLVNNNPGNIDNHATHVQGTIMAGGLTPAARGMAYEAFSTNYDFNDDTQEMTVEALNNDLLVSNHSYGTSAGWSFQNGSWIWRGDPNISTEADWKFGFYDSKTALWDELALHHPYYTIVKAAGNDRNDVGDGRFPPDGPFDIISTYGTAKNIITVGAVRKVNVAIPGPADILMSEFSSWGPTDDGRIKPDLVAPGVGLFSSTSGSDQSYGNSSGTSMSTPVVSGSLLLIQQAFHNLNGRYMLSSSLKGLAIHTAFPTGAGPGPDYQYGWGMLNTKGAVEFLLNNDGINNILIEDEILNGQVKEYVLTPVAGKKITTTLVWTDLPGTPPPVSLNPTNLMLVNDLDMRIVDESGNQIFPYILDPSSPGLAAGKGDNFRDNVEKIDFPNPEQRPYFLKISHKNQLVTGRQRFSLIISYTSENSGLTNLYWIGNSGKWNDGTQWALSSGGNAAGLIPDSTSRAIFDENSFPGNGDHVVQLERDETIGSVIWLSNKEATLDFNGHALSTDATTLLNRESLTLLDGNMLLRFNPSTQEKTFNFGLSTSDKMTIKVDNGGTTSWRIEPGKTNPINLEIKAGRVMLPENEQYNIKRLVLSEEGASLISRQSIFRGLEELRVAENTIWDDMGSEWYFDTGNSSILDINGFEFQSSVFIHGSTLEIIGSNNQFKKLDVKEGEVSILSDNRVKDLKVEDAALHLINGIQLTIIEDLHLNSSGPLLTSIVSPGTATLELIPHRRFCFENLFIENVSLTGFGAVSVGIQSEVIHAENWFVGSCDDLIFANFEIRYPCVHGLTYLIDKSEGNYTQRKWMVDGIETSDESTSFISFDQTGHIEIGLVVGDGEAQSMFSQTIEILDNTLPDNRVIVNPTQLASFRSAMSYQWFRDGQLLSGEVNRVFLHNNIPGIYFVLTFDQMCNRKSVEELFGTSSTDDPPEDNIVQILNVFPNPVVGDSPLYIVQPRDQLQNLTISVIDLAGKILFTLQNQTSSTIPVDMQNVTSGMYILRIQASDKVSSFRFIRI